MYCDKCGRTIYLQYHVGHAETTMDTILYVDMSFECPYYGNKVEWVQGFFYTPTIPELVE